ncbi:hypothetical protein [Brevundimonas poindexterae]|uniref:hypothetical protein n=1 Tax=Brevundimonas poindexterae TaxID=74325 RepID=UPI001CFD4E1C|nr:hypothetical protein [Brevundimonas poindexterae]
MIRTFIFMTALLVSGCTGAPSSGSADADLVEIFDGHLVSLDGQLVEATNIDISLRAGGDDRTVPNHYFLTGGCEDHGFLDAVDGRFWSGSTPSKGLESSPRGSGLDQDCLVEDVERYRRLIALMQEGAVLEFDEDRHTATFTTPSNRAAVFRINTTLLPID